MPAAAGLAGAGTSAGPAQSIIRVRAACPPPPPPPPPPRARPQARAAKRNLYAAAAARAADPSLAAARWPGGPVDVRPRAGSEVSVRVGEWARAQSQVKGLSRIRRPGASRRREAAALKIRYGRRSTPDHRVIESVPHRRGRHWHVTRRRTRTPASVPPASQLPTRDTGMTVAAAAVPIASSSSTASHSSSAWPREVAWLAAGAAP